MCWYITTMVVTMRHSSHSSFSSFSSLSSLCSLCSLCPFGPFSSLGSFCPICDSLLKVHRRMSRNRLRLVIAVHGTDVREASRALHGLHVVSGMVALIV